MMADDSLTEPLLGPQDHEELSDEDLFELYVGMKGEKRKKIAATKLAEESHTLLRKELIADIDKSLQAVDSGFDNSLAQLQRELDSLGLDILERHDFEDNLRAELTADSATIEQDEAVTPPIQTKVSNQLARIEESLHSQEDTSQQESYEAAKSHIEELKEKIKLYYEIKQVKHQAQITEAELPKKVTSKEWFIKNLKNFNDIIVSTFHAQMIDKDGNTKAAKGDFGHQFAADLALSSTLGLVLQAYSLAKLIGKKDKTHEDKVELGIGATKFTTNLIKYPKAMVGMLTQCHAHISQSAAASIGSATTQAMPALFGVTVLLAAATGYQLSLYDKKLKAEKKSRVAMLQDIVSQLEPSEERADRHIPIAHHSLREVINVDNLSKGEMNVLVKSILHPENLTETEKDSMMYKTIEKPLKKWMKDNPKAANKAKLDLYHHQAKISELKDKKKDGKRNLAVQCLTTALTVVAAAFPPSAIGILPVVAVISVGNFLYGLHKDRKKAKASKQLKQEIAEQEEKVDKETTARLSTEETATDESTPTPEADEEGAATDRGEPSGDADESGDEEDEGSGMAESHL